MTLRKPGYHGAAGAVLTWALLIFAAGPAAGLDCPGLTVGAPDVGELRFETGLLFRITRADGAGGYLFGTIHLSRPDDPQIPVAVSKALDASDTFVMEVILDAQAAALMAFEMFYIDGRSLESVAGAELAVAAADLLTRHGIPRTLAATMKPWAAFTTLSMPAGPQTVPLDVLLMQRARRNGATVRGLETLGEQTAVFENLSMSEQIAMLTQAVCHYDAAQRDLEALIALYYARDLRGMLELSTRYVSDPPELNDEFIDALLWQRNDRMVERMLPYLSGGSSFVAVGALHLPGPRGLLEQLAAAGFRVERIY